MGTFIKLLIIMVALATVVQAAMSGNPPTMVSVTQAVPTASSAARPVSAITPEDLLTAALSWSDVQRLFLQPEHRWPELPQFNVGFPANLASKMAGERFFVAQKYRQISSLPKSRAENALTLFDNAKTAAAGFAALRDRRDKDTNPIAGAALGDERRYFTRLTKDKETPYETTIRFRVGPVVGRLSTFNQLGYDKSEALSRHATAVVEKIRKLVDGSLSATSMPEAIASGMPPASVTVGPILGSAVVPVEAWALVELGGTPEQSRDQLRNAGVTELGFRRYGVSSDRDQVIETTLFSFPNEMAAADWWQTFIPSIPGAHSKLNAGKTGSLSAFFFFTKDDRNFGTHPLIL